SEKRVDRLRPLVGGFVVEKSLHRGRIGDLSGEVEIHPAKEFFVRGDRRRRDAIGLHLAEDLVVDVIDRRGINGIASRRRLDSAAPAAWSDGLGRDRELVVKTGLLLARRAEAERADGRRFFFSAEPECRREDRGW